VWIENLHEHSQFSANSFAHASAMRSAMAFPLSSDDETHGVFAFFSSLPQQIDNEAATLYPALGHDIGAFIKARQSEGRLRSKLGRLAYAQRIARLAYWDYSLTSGKFRSSDG